MEDGWDCPSECGADWIFIRPQPVGRALRDHCDGTVQIAFLEQPAAHNRNPESLEELRRYKAEVRKGFWVKVSGTPSATTPFT